MGGRVLSGVGAGRQATYDCGWVEERIRAGGWRAGAPRPTTEEKDYKWTIL